MELSAGKLWGLRRMAGEDGRFCMLAADQRPSVFDLVKERRGVEEAADEDIRAIKRLLVEMLAPRATAVLLDPLHALPGAVDLVSPRQGLIHTLEHHAFEDTADGRLSHNIPDWSVEKIKRAGGDAVKVLAWYRPDAPGVVLSHQQRYVRAIGRACERFDIPFVLELLVYPLASDKDQTKDYVEQPNKRPELVIESVETFADAAYGVDLFKLESPLPASELPAPEEDDGTAQQWFDRLHKATSRPWVVLSAGASADAFRRVLAYAYKAGASGYLAGRAIWADAAQAFPDLSAMKDRLNKEALPYMDELNRLTAESATPWPSHPRLKGGATLAASDGPMPQRYKGFDD